MTGLSRRRFIKGAGAVTLGALAGCTSKESDDPDDGQIKASEPEIDRSIADEVSEEFTEVLEDNSYHQKSMLDSLNDVLEDDGFGSRWYDIESLNNTVYSGGFLQKDEKEGFDILTTVDTLPDKADMGDISDPDNGEYLLSVIVEPALAYMTHQQIYSPIKGQRGEESYDPEAAEEFEENLSGIGCEVRDDNGNTVELYVPERDVEVLWEKIEESIERDTVDEYLDEDVMSYVEENAEYSID